MLIIKLYTYRTIYPASLGPEVTQISRFSDFLDRGLTSTLISHQIFSKGGHESINYHMKLILYHSIHLFNYIIGELNEDFDEIKLF